MSTTQNEIVREALAAIAVNAKQTVGHAGSYHINANFTLRDNGEQVLTYWTVSHFLPSTTDSCTQGMGPTHEAATADLARKLGTPALRAKQLREEAAAKLAAAEQLEATAAPELATA